MSARNLVLTATAVLATATALAAPALAAAPTPTPSQAACDKTPWEPKVQGSPHVVGGDSGGVYLWHSATGFHLRVTHKTGDRAVFHGTITASAAMRLDPVRLEGHDTVALSADRHTLTFAFVNYGHIDGVNFHTDCATALRVARLTRGTAPLPASHVYLGATKAHPSQVPFQVHRIS